MNRPCADPHNQKGSAIVMALMILVVLSLIGIAVSRTSNTEIQIAANDVTLKQNFYQAEAATLEAVDALENASDTQLIARTGLNWLNVLLDMTNDTNWSGTTSTTSSLDANTAYSVVDIGIASGASLDVSASSVHEYAIFGRYNNTDGEVMVQIGYKKRL